MTRTSSTIHGAERRRLNPGVELVVDAAPFRALRYAPAVAGDPASTSAPAYDELERFAYARHRAASPYTVLELLARRAAAGGYDAAGATLERWLRTGVLVPDARPAFYRYEEHELRGGVPAVQRGVLAAVRLEPTDGSGQVLAHERVDPARVADRLTRLEAAPVDLSPVFALAPALPASLRRRLARPPGTPPTVALTDEAGVDHRVWRIDDPEEVAAVRRELAGVRVVIADGHHRYATAQAYRDRRRASGGRAADARASPPWERTLMYVVDAAVDGPRVLPVHRLVPALPTDPLPALAREYHAVPASAAPGALVRQLTGEAALALGLRLPGGRAVLLRPRDPTALGARVPPGSPVQWRGLGAAVLDTVVLPCLGVPPGGSSVEYRPDAAAAAREVDEHVRAALFLLPPVGVETVLALAEAGVTMPPKSTWFTPKPRTGLILRPVDGDAAAPDPSTA